MASQQQHEEAPARMRNHCPLCGERFPTDVGVHAHLYTDHHRSHDEINNLLKDLCPQE